MLSSDPRPDRLVEGGSDKEGTRKGFAWLSLSSLAGAVSWVLVYSAPLVHLLFNGSCGTQSNC
jgi:hypothetical protein